MSRLLLVALCALAVGAACGPPADAPPPRWSSGAALFDALDQVRILDADGAPLEALPVDVSRGPGVLALEVSPGRWRRAGGFAFDLPGVEEPAGALVWEAEPIAHLWLGGQRPTLEHDGVELERARSPGFPNVWHDPRRDLIFWWRHDEDLLLAVGMTPPALTRLTSNAPAPPPAPSAAPLARAQVALGDESRLALTLPAPATLVWPAREIAARSLNLALGVQPRALAHDPQGRPLHAHPTQAPVFVELTAVGADGSRRELGGATAHAGGGYQRVVLPLTDVLGQRVALELSLRPLRTLPEGVTPLVLLADGLFAGAPAGQPGGRGGRPHVVLLQLDTLRADRLGCYGYERDTSPGLDAWAAASAVRFEDAVADSNWTLPSTASLLTGLSTRQHGLLAFPAALDEATPTLAERLRAQGYDTFALTEGGFVSPSFGMDRGFEVFEVQPTHESDWAGALSRLSERGDDRPLFLFLHTYRAHAPWEQDALFADEGPAYHGPLADLRLDDEVLGRLDRGELPATPAEVREVNRRYDAAVRRMDEEVSGFLAELEARVPVEDRLVIITSDHGEHLFEHGHISHGKTLFDAVLRVPLLVSWPGATPVGSSGAPAAGVDVVPTVLDVLGMPLPAGLPGRSLAGVGEGAGEGAGGGDVLRVSQHGGEAHAALRGGYKLVASRAGERPSRAGAGLYHRAQDPGELRDVMTAEPERAATLVRELEAWLQRHAPLRETDAAAAELDPELLGTLKELGYLGDR